MKRLTAKQKAHMEGCGERAQLAIEAYDKGSGEDGIQDLITDLLHRAVAEYPRRQREMIGRRIAKAAWNNFEAEQNGED